MDSKRLIVFILFMQGIDFGFSLDKEFEIPDDWVDPTDMINFDYGTKTNRHKNVDDSTGTKQSEDAQKLHPPRERKSTSEKSQNAVRKEQIVDSPITDSIPEGSEEIKQSGCKHPFLKRFASVLSNKIRSVGSPPRTEKFDIYVHLDQRSWVSLQEFADDCGSNIQEVTRVLEDMITDVHVHLDEDVWIKKFEDYFHMSFDDVLKIGVCIVFGVIIIATEVMSRISWSTQIKRLFVLAFFVSLGMTYAHELKLAEAEYRSKATDIPKECMGNKEEDVSYWKSLTTVWNDMFSVRKDPCVEYHANNLIGPHLRVTPTKVLAVTLTRFAVEPMEHIGTAFSKAFKNIFSGLPVTLWIPAFLFVVLVILGFLLIVAVCFGYNFSFNLPFWAGLQMGPQQMVQNNPELERALEDNRRHIDQLHETIRDLRDRPQQQALTAPDPSPSRIRSFMGYFGFGGNSRDNPPQERPAPPPYPRTTQDLPYPDFDAPQYPNENDFDQRGGGDMGRPEGHAHATSGLRRRHTVPRTRERSEYGAGDPDAQYPPPGSPRYRRSRTMDSPRESRNPIGFEHLVEQDENEPRTHRNGSDPPDHHVAGRSARTAVARPVEELPLPETRNSGRHQNAEERHVENGAAGHSKGPKKTISSGGLKMVAVSAPNTTEPETLPAEEVQRSGNDDSPDVEDWEEISPNEGQCSNENCENTGEKTDSLDLIGMIQREAEEGFNSTE